MGRPKVGVLVKGGRGVYGRWGRWIWGKDKGHRSGTETRFGPKRVLAPRTRLDACYMKTRYHMGCAEGAFSLPAIRWT